MDMTHPKALLSLLSDVGHTDPALRMDLSAADEHGFVIGCSSRNSSECAA